MGAPALAERRDDARIAELAGVIGRAAELRRAAAGKDEPWEATSWWG